ncbi:hypothetical protein BC940DRAFT_344983 [Gongronella butleri]|nr:hypothetical protein BC940DRAFT_344983 [Gongronella butleri]
MDEIRRLLDQLDVDEGKQLTVVSLFGCSALRRERDQHALDSLTIANRVVGKDVFVARYKPLKPHTIEVADDLQLYIDKEEDTAYLFFDSRVTIDDWTLLYDAQYADTSDDTTDASVKRPKGGVNEGFRASTMRGLMLMFLISHLVVPILPPTLLHSELLSTLVILHQAKAGINTHLLQFEMHCWKHWDFSVPSTIFEKKDADSRRERERLNAQLTGWWGPAKGVPLLACIVANVPVPNVEGTTRATLPVFMKKLQDSLQNKLKYVLRMAHLLPPILPDGNLGNIEFRSLFCLALGSYPFLHLIPSIPHRLLKQKREATTPFIDEALPDMDQFLTTTLATNVHLDKAIRVICDDVMPSDDANKQQDALSSVTNMLEEYGDKQLQQFMAHWVKMARHRNPMHVQVMSQHASAASASSSSSTSSSRRHGGNSSHSNTSQEVKQTNIPLPSTLQFLSALVSLVSLIYNKLFAEAEHDDFRKIIMADARSTKGMIQQIDVILRKKIRNAVDIEKVFSRTHCKEIMQKCKDIYLQGSPPYYTESYHLLKMENVLRLYKSMTRGVAAEEYGHRLERECDFLWKQGRQSCEVLSLTGKVCQLKLGHGAMEPSHKNDAILTESSHLVADSSKHSTGHTFTHACTCGRTQMAREDPFDLTEANVDFYDHFGCCLGNGHKAADLDALTRVSSASPVCFDMPTLPATDAVLLRLGAASDYRNSVGLERYEGFTANTNYLIPWILTTLSDLRAKKTGGQQDHHASTATAAALPPATTHGPPTTPAKSPSTAKKPTPAPVKAAPAAKKQDIDWPALGAPIQVPEKAPVVHHVAPLDAFPALGSLPKAPVAPTTAKTSESKPQIETSTPLPVTTVTTQSSASTTHHRAAKREKRQRGDKRSRLENQIRGFLGAEYECPKGHRFLSCGDGRVCKLGHKGHPKEHGKYFVQQDLPLYVLCPCNFADYGKGKMNPDILAQLQRFYIVTPDADVSISLKPRIQITVPESDEPIELTLGIKDRLLLPKNGTYVLRLPFIYRNPATNKPLAFGSTIQQRLNNVIFKKDCFKIEFLE